MAVGKSPGIFPLTDATVGTIARPVPRLTPTKRATPTTPPTSGATRLRFSARMRRLCRGALGRSFRARGAWGAVRCRHGRSTWHVRPEAGLVDPAGHRRQIGRGLDRELRKGAAAALREDLHRLI